MITSVLGEPHALILRRDEDSIRRAVRRLHARELFAVVFWLPGVAGRAHVACDIRARVLEAFDFREVIRGVVVGAGGCSGGCWVSPGGLVGGAGTDGIGVLAGGAGVVGGVLNAEGGVGPGCASGVLPQLSEIENRGHGVVNATLGRFVGELQREFLAAATDLVLEVDAGVVDEKVDVAVRKLGCECWVEVLGTEDVEIQLIGVVVTRATCTAHGLHGAKQLG